MSDAERPRRGGRVWIGARRGLVVGLWLGLLDGATALYGEPLLAGPWLDRLASVAVAMAWAGVLAALLGAGGGCLLRVGTGGGPSRRHGGLEVAAAVASGAAALAVATLGWTSPAAPASDAPPNVVLISLDTLRADHLGAYGYPLPTSPRLDSLARTGVLFERAYSASSWTLPAHVSVFTGLDPFAHGVVRESDRLAESFVTLAERLRAGGYWTGAWVGTAAYGYVGSRYGLGQGFELYRHAPHARRFERAALPRILRRVAAPETFVHPGAGRPLADSVIAWLRGQRREPFFLFVHFYDVHSKFDRLPYEAPGPWRERFCSEPLGAYDGCRGEWCASTRLSAMVSGQEPVPQPEELERIRCLYDGSVGFVDHQVGRLLDALDEEGLAERSVVIVMSDHGEAFFEHSMPLHATLHEEILRIPLIVRAPGVAVGKRARGAVRLIDLAPTILDWVGLEVPSAMQGTSLATVLREWPAVEDLPVLAADHRSSSVALVSGTAKTLHNGSSRRLRPRPRVEHYDLAVDPDEQWNLPPSGPRRRLDAQLETMRAASEAVHGSLVAAGERETVRLSEGERERLRALGYLGADPSDGSEEENE